jgi:hypothetical protein
MTIKRTYEDLNRFAVVAQAWLAKDPANEQGKLAYAITKVMARCEKLLQRYKAKVEDLRIEACLTDEKGKILRDQRGDFEFTQKGLKDFNAARQKLFETEEVEIDPHFATQVPATLTAMEREVFTGIVIREEAEPDALPEPPAEVEAGMSLN